MDPAPVVVGAPVDADLDRGGPPPVVSPPRRRAVLLVALMLVVLLAPLVVALVALHQPRWYPTLDMAETELRVRDVLSSHPPLIGLAGRIGPFGPNGGSHPGPLSFYAVWPVWQLFGGSSFGLLAAQVVLDGVAAGLVLWMAYRRRGLAMALGATAMLSVLMRAYGAYLLTLPWNPYLPVLWWIVFFFAAWSVLDDDLAMLPVGVFAGSMCLQTHISYLGMVGGLSLFVMAALGVRAYRRRGDPEARRAFLRWGIPSFVLGVVLWTPPVIDQIVHTPGNLSTIRDYFSNPPDSPIGMHAGVDAVLSQLDPIKLLTHTVVRFDRSFAVSGSKVPALLLLLAWAGSIVVARRLRCTSLLRFDALLAVALGLGVVSAARIFGAVFFYLVLWAWGLSALMLLAIGWSVAELVRARRDDASFATAARLGVAGLVVLILAVTAVFSFAATKVDVQGPRINASLAALVPPTVDALRARERGGQHGPYLVTWLPDPQAIGSEGYGLLNELDRRGFDVRADYVFRPGATRFHVIDPAQARVEVHLATGAVDIARRRADPRQHEVAYFDPRSNAEKAEFDRLRAELIAQLRAAGLNDRVAQVDDNLLMLPLAPHVPAVTSALITRMLDLGMPTAVFIGSPSSA